MVVLWWCGVEVLVWCGGAEVMRCGGAEVLLHVGWWRNSLLFVVRRFNCIIIIM